MVSLCWFWRMILSKKSATFWDHARAAWRCLALPFTGARSAPVFFWVGFGCGGIRLVVETMLDLLQNFDLVLRLGIEVARVIPLEMRFELASRPPVGIAKMVVDHGIRRFEIDRALELLHGLVVAAEFVIRPAKTID